MSCCKIVFARPGAVSRERRPPSRSRRLRRRNPRRRGVRIRHPDTACGSCTSRQAARACRGRLLRDALDLRCRPDVARHRAARARRHSAAPSAHAKDRALRTPLRFLGRAESAAATSPSLRSDSAGLLGQVGEFLPHARAGCSWPSWPFVPLDDQRLAAFHRGPRVVGDHRHAVRNLHDLLHSGHGLRFVASKLLTLPPNTGQRCNVAYSIPGTFTSIPNRLAADLGRRVQPLVGFPISLNCVGSFSATP